MSKKEPSATILVADDNSKVRDAFKDLLESYGHRVITAIDGQQAIERITTCKPDLILLDINMPTLDGYEVARRVNAKPETATIPIVIVSGSQEVVDRIKALEAGAIDFFKKPVHAKELKARIDSLLKLKAYNDYMTSYQEKLKSELAGSKKELQTSLEAFSRFVPKEFLELLGRKNISDVQPEDQVLMNMAILFSDIRSFTSLSEKMTPQENFKFLNSYLRRMDPFIWDNKGFIDKYIGDSIMALFPEGAESALKAAIEMIKYIPIYNSHRRNVNYDPIYIGIGLHSGTVMLGAIGHERFMQGTIISSNVNLAARLERLTRDYGVSIVASSDIIFGLDEPTKYSYRFLDKIRVRGMDESVSVFEVFDGDPQDQKDYKLKIQAEFEKAVYEYHGNNIEDAQKLFLEFRDETIRDNALEVYCNRCEYFVKHGTKKESIDFSNKII